MVKNRWKDKRSMLESGRKSNGNGNGRAAAAAMFGFGSELVNHFSISLLLFQLGLVVFLTSVSVSSPTTTTTAAIPGGESNEFAPGQTIFKETTLNSELVQPDASITAQTFYFPSIGTTTSSARTFYDTHAFHSAAAGVGIGQFVRPATSKPSAAVPAADCCVSTPVPLLESTSTSPVVVSVVTSTRAPASASEQLPESSNLSHKAQNQKNIPAHAHNDLIHLDSLSDTSASAPPSPSSSPSQSSRLSSTSTTSFASSLPEQLNGNGSGSATAAGNINLHRKLQLWSASGRSAKLNLTHEHESLLRIEPKPRNGSRKISEFLLSSTTSSIPNSFSTRVTTTLPTTTSLSPTTTTSAITQRSRTAAQADDYGAHQTQTQTHPASNPIKLRPLLLETGGEEQDEGYPPQQQSGTGRLLQQYLYPPDWLARHSLLREDNRNTNGTIDYYIEPYETSGRARNSGRQDPFFNFDSDGDRRRNFGVGGEEGEEDSPESDHELSGHDHDAAQTSKYTKYNETASTVKINENLFPPLDSNDNGLADVISRGRIDSVMYVYFGDKYNNDDHKEEIAGRVIQAVGGVIAAIAQILTVLGATKCIRKGTFSNRLPIHIHVGFALLISNLLLLLAVHATEPVDVCASVAVILHYLHLVIGCWFLAHTIQTYKTLGRYAGTPTHLLPSDLDQASMASIEQQQYHSLLFGQRTISSTTFRYCVLTWAAPFPFIIITYLISPEGYETHRFCWMSIERGMVISFIVPIFLLIGLNTVLVILSLRYILALRKLWLDPSCGELEEDLSDGRTISSSVIRASAVLLPLLAVMWFLSVVALENPTSIFFQLAAAGANIALSWLVMYFIGDELWPDRWCSFFNNSSSNLSSSIEDEVEGRSLPSVQPSGAIQIAFDNEPHSSNAVAASVAGTSSSAAPVAGPSSSNSNSTAAIPGPSNSAAPAPKYPSILGRRSFYKNKPNWSRPGGNELYELRHDAISTICK